MVCETYFRITYEFSGPIHLSNLQTLALSIYIFICSLPLVYLANRHAVKEKAKLIKIITYVALFHHILCLILFVLGWMGVPGINTPYL